MSIYLNFTTIEAIRTNNKDAEGHLDHQANDNGLAQSFCISAQNQKYDQYDIFTFRVGRRNGEQANQIFLSNNLFIIPFAASKKESETNLIVKLLKVRNNDYSNLQEMTEPEDLSVLQQTAIDGKSVADNYKKLKILKGIGRKTLKDKNHNFILHYKWRYQEQSEICGSFWHCLSRKSKPSIGFTFTKDKKQTKKGKQSKFESSEEKKDFESVTIDIEVRSENQSLEQDKYLSVRKSRFQKIENRKKQKKELLINKEEGEEQVGQQIFIEVNRAYETLINEQIKRVPFYKGPCKTKNLFSCWDMEMEQEEELWIIEPYYCDKNKNDQQQR